MLKLLQIYLELLWRTLDFPDSEGQSPRGANLLFGQSEISEILSFTGHTKCTGTTERAKIFI